ncbi:MAG: oligosaccharide flippase family protein [Phyllobacteriaceae bacterium]|nr:oligosaccharide flippase family protein [Phyllobacteriaceae bacterium]
MRSTAASTASRLLPHSVSQRLRPLAEKAMHIVNGRDSGAAAKRIALTAFAVRILSAAIALISQVILARLMGTFEYGIFVLVWTAMVIAGNISCFGFQVSVIRFVPQYREQGDLPRLRGMVWTSRWFVFGASTFLAALGLGILELAQGRIETYYVAPFLLGIVLLPMIALGDYITGLARAQGWAMLSLLPIYVVRPILILLLVMGAIAFGAEATAQNALIASIAATYFATIGALLALQAKTPPDMLAGHKTVELRHWVAVSLPIFLVEGFYFTMTNADVLMIGLYLPPEKVAVYFAAVKILALVHFVNFAVRAGAAQRFSALVHSDDMAGLGAFARQTVQWMFWPSVFMAIIMVGTGDLLLKLFGAEYSGGHALMIILTLGIVARASVGPCESILTMSGQEKACAVAYGLALAINMALNILLIPRMGLQGAAVATAIAMVFEALVLSALVYRRMGIAMFVFARAAKG